MNDNSRTPRGRADDDAFDTALGALLRRTHDTPAFDERATLARIEATIGAVNADADADRNVSSTDAAAVARVVWGGRLARPVLAVAASLALFIGGAEYGRHTAVPIAAPASAPPPALVADARSLPLTIQSAGSQYIATLARLGQESDRLTPEQRRTAREVALSALLGAALELLQDDAGDDAGLRNAADLIADVKAGLAVEPAVSGTPF